LSDKIDATMLMLPNDRAQVDPNNVPLASLVAQEEHVDVNFIRNNNFNNNAYRNNFASNNYRMYLIRLCCITILYHNLLLFIDIFHI
jgi:hypothetical protein